MNLKNGESTKAAIEKTINHFQKIDLVVNNASQAQIGAMEELSDEEA
ncbi:MAG: hypothetical protein PVH88_11595 [Ignavibacteria bacterium]|jgi:NADP-dependent 3-hydroxy acid dehydrogenase YdfG